MILESIIDGFICLFICYVLDQIFLNGQFFTVILGG